MKALYLRAPRDFDVIDRADPVPGNDDTLIRVGNEEYAATNETYGLTTLRPDHVERAGTRSFAIRFVGKSGVEHEVSVTDPKLARLVRRCHELDGQVLFSYADEGDALQAVSSSDVNEYLHELVGLETTAKVSIEVTDAGPTITRIDLSAVVDVDLPADAIDGFAADAKQNCPVSKALSGVETVNLKVSKA